MIINLNGSEDSNNSVDDFEEFIKDCPFEFNASESFRSTIDFVLVALFHDSSLNISEQKIKLFMVTMGVVVKLKEKYLYLELPA
ncbi:hypothetical protein RMATCC62417_17581 [Rhizopus microsporus]|nr:hypothetical protein RMATCC62417_17581 [Rhizopus microsporus]